jgi:sulfur carrier protein ThiS
MGTALFRFYEELNDRLPPDKRKRDFEVPLEGKATVREIIKRLGVPPEEVDLLLVNGESVGLDHGLKDGDRVSVYPVFERLDIRGVSRVREDPLRRLRFVVDNELGGLAQSLTKLGLDVCFSGDFSGAQIRQLLREKHRILLTERGNFPGWQGLARVIVLNRGSLQEQITRLMESLDLREVTPQETQDEREEQREPPKRRKGPVDRRGDP